MLLRVFIGTTDPRPEGTGLKSYFCRLFISPASLERGTHDDIALPSPLLSLRSYS
jgi:hypothetical protein